MKMRFVDLFAGIGGFHIALSRLGHECVFACELDEELRRVYAANFPKMANRLHGDIRTAKHLVPAHDILCAGFPCQPFSKSGPQHGFADQTRGTLFRDILDIIIARKPTYIFLENVGNFERHDRGRTWTTVKGALQELGYFVFGTEHKASGGHGLVSPHHLGFPHTRERFFIVASLLPIRHDPFPPRTSGFRTSLRDIVQPHSKLTALEREETRLPEHYVRCIEHWNRFLRYIPKEIELPSFPIWGDEFGARYPFEDCTPHSVSTVRLKKLLGRRRSGLTKTKLLATLPSYAREECEQFPAWKRLFIRQNREWFNAVKPYVPKLWLKRLRDFPPSLRKLEWNCKGEKRDLWEHVLQFRPSGLRAKRYSASPALVAMTTSQIPILGPERRFLTKVEGLRLQGFPDSHLLPSSRAAAFSALGNAVHVGVVTRIAERTFGAARADLAA